MVMHVPSREGAIATLPIFRPNGRAIGAPARRGWPKALLAAGAACGIALAFVPAPPENTAAPRIAAPAVEILSPDDAAAHP